MIGERGLRFGVVLGIAAAMLFSGFGAVAVIPDADVDESLMKALPTDSTLYINGYVFDCLVSEPALPPTLTAAQQAPGAVAQYLVHMGGPIRQDWTDAISGLGAEIVAYVPNNAYEVRMTQPQAEKASGLWFVDWVGAYHPAYKVSQELDGPEVTVVLNGEKLPLETLDAIRGTLNVYEEGYCEDGYLFHGALKSSEALAKIAAYPQVQFISPYREKQLMDEAGMQITGGYMWYNDPDSNVNTPYRTTGTHGAYVNHLGWDGSGVIVGIADSGLGDGTVGNAGHPDFTGRVIGGYDYGTGGWLDQHGHGTHCAGLIAADGSSGTGTLYAGFGPYYAGMGIGHAAQLYSEQIFEGSSASWVGPSDSGLILVQGYSAGARVHSNSWGAPTGSAYDILDQEYDTRVRDADPVAAGCQQLITFVSAGNSGPSAGTMGSPGNGKNVIAIGSTQNYMPDATSHGCTDVNVNNPDAVSSFSSRGWSDDGRIKPDICTPGEGTLSTRSPSATSDNLYGFYTEDTRYQWCSGTSQACPTAAGGGAAIYEWYQTTYGTPPTPAMVKGLLINSAVDIGTADIPNQNEGWGRMYLPTIMNPPAPWFLVDGVSELTTGTYDEYSFSYANSGQPLKVSLVYTDKNAVAGASVHLVNNLDLRVTSPLGSVYHGNAFSGGVTPAGTNPIATWDTNSDGWDDRNNVECAYIPAAQLQSGLYTVRISGFNVPGDCDNDGTNDQDYALIVYNAQDVTSYGVVDIELPEYAREASVQVQVRDMDLNVNTGVQTTTITVTSLAEPAGESLLLTETGGDTGVFEGFLTISATNGAGVLWVGTTDTITATYNDADYGGTGPLTLTDTAAVDGTPPGAPSGLTVTWDGVSVTALASQDFSGTYPPTGWSEDDATNNWNQAATANAGGTSPEARFNYVSSTSTWRLKCGPLNTAGLTSLDLQWNNFYDDYGDGVTVRVQTATSTSGPWTNSAWAIASGGGNVGPGIQTTTLTSNVGSGTFYFAFVVDGNAYQLDYWYIDNVLLSYSVPTTDDNRLDWTLSTDDGAGANDVVKYIVYRSNAQAGPWDAAHEIAEVTPGTDTYTDPGRGEFDGNNWWYVVRAEDNVGNRDTNTNAIPEIPVINLPPSAPNTPTPSNGATGVSVNPTLQVRASDPNGDPMTVRFYNAAGPTLIGTNTNVPSGTFTSLIWPGRSQLTSYSWYATADDGEFVTQSSTWSFTTMDTTPPGAVTGLTVDWWGMASGNALNENFAGGIPATWTIVDGGSGGGAAATWTTANPGGRTATAPITTPFAIVDSDNAGSAATQDEQLITPVMNLASASTATLAFDHYFYRYQTEIADVDVRSSNTGGTWTNVYRITGASSTNPNHQSIDISTQAAGAADAQVRFHYYSASYEWYWMVDNVVVSFTGGGTTNDNLLNWTLSSDDGAGADDVVQYNVYRSDLSSGPWDVAHLVNTVPAGTDTYTDANRGEPDGINWWYVVRAEDVWGNEETNTNAVPETGAAPPPYAISLTGKSANSWVFISFPSGLTGNIQTILNDATSGDGGTTWSIAKWYNPQTPNDPWKTYRAGGSFNDMPTVNNAMGFWIWITANGGDQALTLSSYADIPAVTNINLYAGWNLVGYPSMTDRPGTAAPASVDIISTYLGSAAYNDYTNKALVTLHHGNAYFMRCTANTLWPVTNP